MFEGYSGERLSEHNRVGDPMRNLTAIEIKAFVPAKDFELSKRFYQDLGFTIAWSSDGLATFGMEAPAFYCKGFKTRCPTIS